MAKVPGKRRQKVETTGRVSFVLNEDNKCCTNRLLMMITHDKNTTAKQVVHNNSVKICISVTCQIVEMRSPTTKTYFSARDYLIKYCKKRQRSLFFSRNNYYYQHSGNNGVLSILEKKAALKVAAQLK